MSDATFDCCELTTFWRVDELGLEVVGQRVERDRAQLACRVAEPDRWCRRYGAEGTPRDSVVRRLAHAPFGWRPTTLVVTVRRYRCGGCGHVWRQRRMTPPIPRRTRKTRPLPPGSDLNGPHVAVEGRGGPTCTLDRFCEARCLKAANS